MVPSWVRDKSAGAHIHRKPEYLPPRFCFSDVPSRLPSGEVVPEKTRVTALMGHALPNKRHRAVDKTM